MSCTAIQQQITVLSNTINMVRQKYAQDPWDVELQGTCIKIRRHLLDHLYKNDPPILATGNYCLSDYRKDISTPPDV